jgi:pimeloyl-ACP methyl ester carboxylesterase
MTYREYPVFFPSGPERLCGVVCVPDGSDGSLGVVLLTGHRARTHRNQMFVRLARELAARGVPSLRFDYRGVGDSTGTLRIDLATPSPDDAEAAVGFLRAATGVAGVALVSTCFGGAGSVIAAARHRDVKAIVAFSMPILLPHRRGRRPPRKRAKRWLRRALPWKAILRAPGIHRLRGRGAARGGDQTHVSPAFARSLAALLHRGVAARFIFGERSHYLEGIRRAVAELEPSLSAEERGRVRLDVVRDAELHRFKSIDEQDLLVREALEAVDELRVAGRPLPAPEIVEVVRPAREGQLVGRVTDRER